MIEYLLFFSALLVIPVIRICDKPKLKLNQSLEHYIEYKYHSSMSAFHKEKYRALNKTLNNLDT